MPTPEQRICDVYGFDFPPDFFRFREFLAALPKGLLSGTLEMHPEYPFKAAEGKRPSEHRSHPLWESRYFNDPPEFVTVMSGRIDGLHWGYYFDDPADGRAVVCHYWSSDSFEFGIDGDNLFSAVRDVVERSERDFLDYMEDEPDDRDDYERDLKRLEVIRSALGRFWGTDRPERGEEYLDAHGGSSWRKPAAETRDHTGVVVPKRLFRKLPGKDPSKVWDWNPTAAEVAKLAAKAMQLLRDGFPGAALKLGKDLWAYPKHRAACYELLDAAYEALGRDHLRRLLDEARAFREHCDRGRRASS
jgi:hypothetical protein